MPHLVDVAAQEILEGGHGARQCATQMVTACFFDYSNHNTKDKARAFHMCKMSLARQVLLLLLLLLLPPQNCLAGSTVVRLYSCEVLGETSVLLQ